DVLKEGSYRPSWNLVVDELLSLLNDSGFYTVGYADNLVILLTDNHERMLCELMQTALHKVERWCQEIDLTVNPRTCSLHKKRKLGILKPPPIFGVSLNFATEVKYLGVMLDSNLYWGRHLQL